VRARFTEAASADLREARTYYGKRRREARIGFNREMRKAVALLREHPKAGKPAGRTAREYVIDNVYPYSLIYYVENDEVVIAALSHHSRNPEFWHDRFGPER
jgi:toxin ParE1/3/4